MGGMRCLKPDLKDGGFLAALGMTGLVGTRLDAGEHHWWSANLLTR